MCRQSAYFKKRKQIQYSYFNLHDSVNIEITYNLLCPIEYTVKKRFQFKVDLTPCCMDLVPEYSVSEITLPIYKSVHEEIYLLVYLLVK